MGPSSSPGWWAAVPVAVWAVLILVGPTLGSALCAVPVAGHVGAAVLLAGSALAAWRATSLARVGNLPAGAMLVVGWLFTAGIAVIWAMVGFAPCA